MSDGKGGEEKDNETDDGLGDCYFELTRIEQGTGRNTTFAIFEFAMLSLVWDLSR